MKFYYFNSTHWDREWYMTFQEFRKALVNNTKKILECLKKPGFEHFVFDGQTILLEDVTEVRTDLKTQLREVIASGQLKVGPWYAMPDEFLVSGEALIRNLLTGRRLAREYGAEPWPVAYVCDVFGHIAQLPQINNGFGLAGIVAWRGFDHKNATGQAFRWQSPDGSESPLLRLPFYGYGEFAGRFRRKLADENNENLFEEGFRQYMQDYGEKNQADEDFLFLPDGLDHYAPLVKVPELLVAIQKMYPDAEVIHSDAVDVLRNECAVSSKVIHGEQIYPAIKFGMGRTLSGTLSSRYDLKRRNDLCQNMLELVVEPELAVRTAARDTEDLTFLRHAWMKLLRNQAHDSICGCSVDAVHRRMFARYDDADAIAQALMHEFADQERRRITPEIHTDIARFEADPEGNYCVRIYNPLPFDITGTRQLELQIPSEPPYPEIHSKYGEYEPYARFCLFGEADEKFPFQTLHVRRNQLIRCVGPQTKLFDIHTVLAYVTLQASTWTTLRLRPEKLPVRHCYETLRNGSHSAENAFAKLEILHDGAVCVTDKESGRVYRNINTFELVRDIGDGWFVDQPLSAPKNIHWECRNVRIFADGPERVTFDIEHSLKLPHNMEYTATGQSKFRGLEESKNTTELILHVEISIERESKILPFRIYFKNSAEDFLLRWKIPTGIDGNAFASQSFAMLERSENINPETSDYFEPDFHEKNFDGILGKRDEKGGIALLSRAGLHAGGPLDDVEHSLSVILLRAFGHTVFTNGETECQIPGTHVFDGALALLSPKENNGILFHALQTLRTEFPLLTVSEKIAIPDFPESFVQISGNLVVSAMKPSDLGTPGTVLLRLFNQDSVPQEALIRGGWKQAFRCRLDETEDQPLESSNPLKISAGAGEILTLKLQFR